MNRSVFFLICVSIVVFLSACGGEEQFKETISLEQFQESSALLKQEEEQTKIKATTAPPVMPGGPEGSDYLLGPGDLLSVKVFESEELNTEVRVSSRGIINLPLLKDVNVLNMTAAEAEQTIEDLYRQKYLHDPHVAIYIKEHMSKQITLIGAVQKPGTYEYVSRRRLLDVLAMGSGLSVKAGSVAYITRQDHKTGDSFYYLVDLDDLVKNGNMAHNYPILGGDVVFVPESGNCFVDGAVRKPGTYPISSNMTIAEAISMAGGLAGWADNDKVKLIRYMGRGKPRQVVSLSYTDVQSGVGDTLVLQDQDIIYAESSASGKLFSGSGFTLGFMGTGITFRNPDN